MPTLDFDDELTASGGQAVTADAVGTRPKDAGVGKTVDWGAGETIVPYFRITHAANSNPTTGETVSIVAADDAALTINAVVLSSKYVLTAELLLDTVHQMPPLLSGTSRRFLGCKFANTGGAPATGSYIVGFMDKDGRPQDGVAFL
jgi:hypothetical protein